MQEIFIRIDLKVTTEILWKGALAFALIDILMVSVLTRTVSTDIFRRLNFHLPLFMALFFSLLFGIVVSMIFWDTVYGYLFPAIARWIIPPAYGILFAFVGILFYRLSLYLHFKPVLVFCLLGGLWGFLTHLLAIHRGVLEKPPMLRGTSPAAALTLTTFEFIFYWSACLGITYLIYLVSSGYSKEKH